MTYTYNPEAIKGLYGDTPGTAEVQLDSVFGSVIYEVNGAIDVTEPYHIAVDGGVTALTLPPVGPDQSITVINATGGNLEITTTAVNPATPQKINGVALQYVATFTGNGSVTFYCSTHVADSIFVTASHGTVAFGPVV